MQVPEGYKLCTGCKQVLKHTPKLFHRDNNVSSGLKARCKTCCLSELKEKNKHKRELTKKEEANEGRQGDEDSDADFEVFDRQMFLFFKSVLVFLFQI